MPKKQRQTRPERFVSKHQLSRWQRQKRQRNITLIIGAAVILSVIAIFGVGFYRTEVYPYNRTALKVDGTKFNVRYYVNMLKLAGRQGTIDFSTAQIVEAQIQQQELIRQAAASLGFTIVRSEAEEALKKANQPVSKEMVDLQTISLLMGKLHEEYFKPKVPASQPQVNLQAMLLETEDAANKAKARIASGEDFARVAEELSRDGYTKGAKGEIGWVTQDEAGKFNDSTKFAGLAFGAAPGEVTGPVFDDSISKDIGFWVVKVLEKADEVKQPATPKRVHAEGILLGSEQEAGDVIARLNSGADFDTVAKEVSQQPGVKEGNASPDMGWIDFSDQLSDFEKSLFDLPQNAISGPLTDTSAFTKGGFWLIKAVEKSDDRPLSAAQIDAAASELHNKWIEEVTADPDKKAENLIDQDMRTFAILKSAVAGGN